MTGGRRALLRRGIRLEYATLAWNAAGIAVLALAAVGARSVALAAFGLDSMFEIAASALVIRELCGSDDARQQRALQLLGGAFIGLAICLAAQTAVALATRWHPDQSRLGLCWTIATAMVMLGLAAAKGRTGRALDNPVLIREARVTLIDGLLAVAVTIGLILNAELSWWWADPLAALALIAYAAHEGLQSARVPATAP